MICGTIDVGSNTIRLSIYKCDEHGIKLLLNKKTMAGLAGYVENGNLSARGIEKACTVLKSYTNILKNFDITNVYAFATASLRNVKNTEAAVLQIRMETGLEIDVISGKEEAILDFVGAIRILHVKDGILVDIGGGSTELVVYKDSQILKAVSIPIGSLWLFSNHVRNLLPTSEERKEMRAVITQELEKLADLRDLHCPIMCGVGGTVRATLKLNNDLMGQPPSNKVIETQNIKKVLKYLNNNDRNTVRKILQVVPDRIHTIIPGMILLNTITKYFESETIFVSNYGVREGYLIRKVLKEREQNDKQK